MDGWKTSFPLGWPNFRCYVSFRDCSRISEPSTVVSPPSTSSEGGSHVLLRPNVWHVARTSPGHVKPSSSWCHCGKKWALPGHQTFLQLKTWKMKINMGVGCQGLFGVVVVFSWNITTNRVQKTITLIPLLGWNLANHTTKTHANSKHRYLRGWINHWNKIHMLFLEDLDFCDMKMLKERVPKKHSPKWWCKMLIFTMVQSARESPNKQVTKAANSFKLEPPAVISQLK